MGHIIDEDTTPNAKRRMPRPRILVVDDRPDKRLTYSAVLEGLDADIVMASSGEEALKLALGGRFAVVLLDVRMPGMDGLETASLLRQHHNTRTVPIIFVTGYDDDIQSARGYELGAVDYILAPVVAPVLRTKVSVFLDTFKAQSELARANEELESRVRERTAELERSNERLQSEIAVRLRAENEREALLAREKLLRTQAEDLSQLKDEFLATMSHELRTPLNAIFGWITLLRTRRLDEATQARALETIERNARAQKRLIEDLLDVSRIVSGKLALELVEVDARAVVEGAIATMEPAARAKGVRIVPLLTPAEATVRGDFARLQQVVCNLLSNAIKFTPSAGTVQVVLAAQAEQVEIAVSDTGQGIKPQFLPHVFDRFRQEDGSISRRHGGLGLGLAIVRHLVDLHAGTVEVTSEGEGRGARFVVRLPLREPMRRAAPADRCAVPLAHAALLAGVRVLVVEADPGARELVCSALAQFGARVLPSDSAQDALAQLLEKRPDVLIADLGLPRMDGCTLIEQVRALDPQRGGGTPAVALTAYGSEPERARALAAGYQHLHPRPVEPTDLANIVAGLCARRGAGRGD